MPALRAGYLTEIMDVIDGLYTFRDACMWVDEVYQESQPLMHNELSAAIHTDLVFGKRRRTTMLENRGGREGCNPEQRYQTYDVVPLACAELVENNYQNYKNHHLSMSAGAFWLAYKAERIFNRESKLTTRQGDNHVCQFLLMSSTPNIRLRWASNPIWKIFRMCYDMAKIL